MHFGKNFSSLFLVPPFNKVRNLKKIELNFIDANGLCFCKVKSWLMRRNVSGHCIIQQTKYLNRDIEKEACK